MLSIEAESSVRELHCVHSRLDEARRLDQGATDMAGRPGEERSLPV